MHFTGLCVVSNGYICIVLNPSIWVINSAKPLVEEIIETLMDCIRLTHNNCLSFSHILPYSSYNIDFLRMVCRVIHAYVFCVFLIEDIKGKKEAYQRLIFRSINEKLVANFIRHMLFPSGGAMFYTRLSIMGACMYDVNDVLSSYMLKIFGKKCFAYVSKMIRTIEVSLQPLHYYLR